MLKLELQKRGESQDPEGGGDDDKVGVCKLLCVPKARVREIACFQKTLPLLKKISHERGQILLRQNEALDFAVGRCSA